MAARGGEAGAAAGEAQDALGMRLKVALDRLADRRRPAGRDAVCCRGLTFNQWALLRTLCEEGGGAGLPMGALAARLGLTPSGATRCAGPLAERGLIERRLRPGDRRVCCLIPTLEGMALGHEITAECAAGDRALLDRLPAGDREAAVRAVERLAQEAGAIFLPPDPCCLPDYQENKESFS
ncbi:MAG: MarR family transcriptional regulator [Candidatus Tectomicrobia bacterium]|nr:MarR family transcriptional regulator [Candidatus Tectomicrobia bacterium]